MLFGMLLFVAIVSCTDSQKKVSSQKQEIEKPKSISPRDSLQSELMALGNCNFEMDSLRRLISNNDPYNGLIEIESHPWLFQFMNDEEQFDQVHLIKPLCKLFESSEILSVAFTDVYDYKSAIHIISFKREDFRPLSSFLFFSSGGDAEDFWRRLPKKIGPCTYEITYQAGHVNDIQTRDTTFYDIQEITEIEINSNSGFLTKSKISVDSNFIELKKQPTIKR